MSAWANRRKLRKQCPFCGTKYLDLVSKLCPGCDDIDFNGIDTVVLADRDVSVRTQVVEEFDPVMTNHLTDLDGWQHYETRFTEHSAIDGENLSFVIAYKNETVERRVYHSSSRFAQMLMEHSTFFDISESLDEILADLKSDAELSVWAIDYDGDNFDYEFAKRHFLRRVEKYCLKKDSEDTEFIKAAVSCLLKSYELSDELYYREFYELMLYLLSADEDTDVFEVLHGDIVSFTQTSPKGTDAFVVLPKRVNASNQIVSTYDYARRERNYRKIMLISTGKNTSTIKCDDMIIWDRNELLTAYDQAFKKSLNEPAV